MRTSGADVAMFSGLGTGNVDPPMTRAVPAASNIIGVPEIFAAGAPGATVWSPMMRSELGPR